MRHQINRLVTVLHIFYTFTVTIKWSKGILAVQVLTSELILNLSQTDTESVIIFISCDEIILNAYNINVLVGASVILQFP